MPNVKTIQQCASASNNHHGESAYTKPQEFVTPITWSE